MPLQFQTENFMPQDPTMQQIYSPLFAALGGQQTARIQQSQEQALRDAEEAIRERQLLNIGRQRDAYKAQLEMTTPDFMEQKLRGESGTSATQEAAGKKAIFGLPGDLADLDIENKISKARQIAADTTLPMEQRTAAMQDMIMLADMASRTSKSAGAERLQDIKGSNSLSKLASLAYQEIRAAQEAGRPVADWAVEIQNNPTILQSATQGTQAKNTIPFFDRPTQQPPNAVPSQMVVPIGSIPTEAAARASMVTPNEPMQTTPRDMSYDLSEINRALASQTLSAENRAILEKTKEEILAGKKGTGMDAAPPLASGEAVQTPTAVKTPLISRAGEGSIEKGKVYTKQSASGREARYSDNVAIAANEARTAVQNISSMPFKTTSGIFGATREEKNIFSAPVNALKNKLSNESTTSYNAEVDNIGSFYARLINGGLSPSQSEINKFTNQFRIREGEDGLTALTRLAQMRQAFERAAEVKINSKATPPEQLDMWRNAVADVKEAIPLTVADVNKFRDLNNPKKSFNEFMRETKQSVDSSTETVTVNGKTYSRPANMTDTQWSNYKKAVGVQ